MKDLLFYEQFKKNSRFITVFLIAFYTIVLELIISRMSVFYLNYGSSFLAIPITLFGLGVGSLHVHLSKKSIDSFDISKNIIGLVLASFSAFILVFFIFSRFVPILNIQHRNEINLITNLKTVVFGGIFVLVFYFIGKILTILFTRNKDIIGKLYSTDLIGASLGCFAAPVLFHFIDLGHIILILFLLVSFYMIYYLNKVTFLNIAGVIMVNVLVFLSITLFESNYDMAKTIFRRDSQTTVKEIMHGWNEFSRVSLLRIGDGPGYTYRIVHDNAESNVHVGRYTPGLTVDYNQAPSRISIPFNLGRKTDDILVMFAGCGMQMIQYHEYSGGKSKITGVEINQLVKDFALKSKEIRDFKMKEFYDLPNVNLIIEEGRAFLDKTKDMYDVIYVGSDAATSQVKTGHSRKYLDTYEGLVAYLKHLKQSGIMIFDVKPGVHRIQSLKKYFDENGIVNFDKCVIVFTTSTNHLDTVVVSLKPFSRKEIDIIIRQFVPFKLVYAPGYDKNKRYWTNLINGPVPAKKDLVTDDKPFIYPIDYENYNLFASVHLLTSKRYFRSWIKLTTLFMVLVVLLGILIYLYISRAKMPPVNMVVYLIITGFCYMLAEISYIAKLELFLGNPLLSMALLLCIFLVSNSFGSRYFDKLKKYVNMDYLPIYVAAMIFIIIWIMNYVVKFVGLHIIIKLLLTVLLISPVAFCLGLFYPYVVTWLNTNKREASIPITYGISTLSSVAGATYAMTMIINFGFTAVLTQAIIGYAVLFVFTMIFNFIKK